MAQNQKKSLSAKEVLTDVKAGMSDADLMSKYRLSSQGLQSLLKKMVAAGLLTQADLNNRMLARPSAPAKPKLNAKVVIGEIKSGMSDADLMKKYGISEKGLQSLFSKLLKASLISQADLDARTPDLLGTVDIVADTFPEPSQTPHLWRCPSCQAPQSKAHDVCPQCGIIVEKFQEKQARNEALRQEQQFQIDRQNLLKEAASGNVEALTVLLDRGVPADTTDPRTGRTALIEAATNGHLSVVELLLDRGADPEIKDLKGRTALAEAERKRRKEVLALLNPEPAELAEEAGEAEQAKDSFDWAVLAKNYGISQEDLAKLKKGEIRLVLDKYGLSKSDLKNIATGLGLRVGSLLTKAGDALQASAKKVGSATEEASEDPVHEEKGKSPAVGKVADLVAWAKGNIKYVGISGAACLLFVIIAVIVTTTDKETTQPKSDQGGVPFPVTFAKNERHDTKEFLVKLIRLSTIKGKSPSVFTYGGRNFEQILQDIVASEYDCPPMAELDPAIRSQAEQDAPAGSVGTDNLPRILTEKWSRVVGRQSGTGQSSPNTRQQVLDGMLEAAGMGSQLSTLSKNQLNAAGLPQCSKAIKELEDLVERATSSALVEKSSYLAAIREQKERMERKKRDESQRRITVANGVGIDIQYDNTKPLPRDEAEVMAMYNKLANRLESLVLERYPYGDPIFEVTRARVRTDYYFPQRVRTEIRDYYLVVRVCYHPIRGNSGRACTGTSYTRRIDVVSGEASDDIKLPKVLL